MFSSQTQLAAQTISTPSTGTGVIVLSMTGRILHIDDSALDFVRRFEERPPRPQQVSSVLPPPLMDLFHDVLAGVEKHIAAEDWSQFVVHRPVRSVDGMVLLRGFGMPDRTRRQQSRILLVLQQPSEASPS
ncbi:MAG: hypothetical protein OJF47_003126 [Nitrospira sp.]|jgi:hypothetical protein|nr:MAG: hypothetical protein OJF47_003126 [Nitrospira sp.]